MKLDGGADAWQSPRQSLLQSLRQAFGFELREADARRVADAIKKRAAILGYTHADDYLNDLWRRDQNELQLLAEELTVGETYFFRHQDQLDTFTHVALPRLLAGRPPGEPVRVLCAGCSTGEEAYSLAILASIHLGSSDPTRIQVFGRDLNARSIQRARTGCYGPWSLRQTPSAIRRTFFAANSPGGGEQLCVRENIRKLVNFEQANLLEPSNALPWSPGSMHVIFCRNVMIYLAPEARAALAGRFAEALVPGGFLFLGLAETLRGISDDFQLEHSAGSFFYTKRGTRVEGPRSLSLASSVPMAQSSPEPQTPLQRKENLGRQAAGKNGATASQLPSLSHSQERAPASRQEIDLLHAPASLVRLLQEERYSECLARLDSGLPYIQEFAAWPRRTEFQAALRLLLGQWELAERDCLEALRQNDLSAMAHHLLSLCRAAVGDDTGALREGRAAVYLDSDFAMAYLNLGWICRRLGDQDGARRSLERAVELLSSESRPGEELRLLLLGGGFGRSGLAQIAASELRELIERRI